METRSVAKGAFTLAVGFLNWLCVKSGIVYCRDVDLDAVIIYIGVCRGTAMAAAAPWPRCDKGVRRTVPIYGSRADHSRADLSAFPP